MDLNEVFSFFAVLKIPVGLDAFYSFPGSSIKPRHERYRRFGYIEYLGGSDS
jgi:hypothetical protein